MTGLFSAEESLSNYTGPGVYEILHTPSGKSYIGSAANVVNRWSTHKCELRKGNHHCVHLQRMWTKHKESEFEFNLLETCEVSDLAAKEQFYMDQTDKEFLMNSQPFARTCRGFKHTVETKTKMAAAAKRISTDPEERRRRSERAKLMHAQGRLPPKPVLPIKPKTCVKCLNEFVPVRLPSGSPSGTKWCDTCRPPHKGGQYKTADHW